MATTEEKLIIQGGQAKLACARRQMDSKAQQQSGIICDYLRFTIHRENIPDTKRIPRESEDRDLAKFYALHFANLLGYQLGIERPGRDYYDHTHTIENDFGHEVASVSAGGESQRGTIAFTIKGEGCSHATEGWEKRVHDYFAEMTPTITRVDLSKDFFEGEVSIEEVVHLYKCHEFSYRNRLPSYTTHGSWDLHETLDGIPLHGHSRTFQIGKRESGKLARFYEKGHQYRLMDSKWLRAEVEFRNVGRVLLWEMLLAPAEFFAGAYPAMKLICDHETETKIPTAAKTGEASAQRCINWVQRVVAPTLVQLVSCTGNDDWLHGLVLDQQHRKVPRSLRGLNHHTMAEGLCKALSKYTSFMNPAEPACAGL